MKGGKVLLAVAGVTLIVAGLLLAALGIAVGLFAAVLGVVLLVLGTHDWNEFKAQVKDIGFTITRGGEREPAPVARAPELEILSVEEGGGNNQAIEFRVAVANRGTKSCRARLEADVDGWDALCRPDQFDLGADDGVHKATVYVSRPAMGTLIREFNNRATLYGRRLTVRLSADGQTVDRSWREHVYSDEENSVRAAIQRAKWREGADLHPARLEVGLQRTRFCQSCDDVTDQVLTHLQRSGAGQPIAWVWHCQRHGGSPN